MVSWNWSDIVKSIQIRDFKFVEYKSENFTWSLVPFYLNCQMIDLKDHFNLTETAPKVLFFHIAKLDNLKVTIQMIEKNKISLRPIQSMSLAYRGPAITKRLKANKTLIFWTMNKIEQTIKSERDKSQPCQNYPTDEYQSFGDCDRSYVRRRLSEHFNFMPFWAAEKLSDVSKHGNRNDLDHTEFMGLAQGIEESSCVKPCLDTEVIFGYFQKLQLRNL